MVEDVFGDLSQDVDVFRYLLGVRGFLIRPRMARISNVKPLRQTVCFDDRISASYRFFDGLFGGIRRLVHEEWDLTCLKDVFSDFSDL